MKKKLKEKLSFLIFVIMIILGIAIILYPVISNHLSKINYQEIIDNYDFKVAKQKNSYNEQLVNEARKYNSSLTSLNITDVFQNQIGQSSSEYFSVLNVDNNGMMGYISIPKIDIKIPIYHGTSSDILQKGVGHLEGSSIPIGGENTHAVLSAHRGLPSSRLFTDLDQLKVGDTFYIHILDEVLAYRVNQVLVVEPSDIDFLQIVKGKDYVTLVTCTPYAINTHRLLVRGERIEYSAQEEESIAINKKMSIADIVLYTCLIFAVLLIIGSIISITHYQKRKVIDKNIK
ncbi:MAG: class C sortase [Bacilli bacterium]|nr:class C sortase [Bacilli bacterium]